MKKMNINKKVIAVTAAMVIATTTVGGIYVSVKANDTAVEETGALQQTLGEYESDQTTSYIGWGYNIIDKNYINAADVQKSPIFNTVYSEEDPEKKNIWDTNIIVDGGTNNINTYEIVSDTTSSFIKEFLNKISGGVGILGNWCGFTQITPRASFVAKDSSTGKAQNKYIMHVRQMETAYVNWLLDEEEYYDYLTERFKKDVMTMEPMDLFNKYGTHVLTGVKMGGKVEIKSQLSSNSVTSLQKAVAKLNLDVEGIFDTKLAKDTTDNTIKPTQEATGGAPNQPNQPQNPEVNLDDPSNEVIDESKELAYELSDKNQDTTKDVYETTYTTCYGGKGFDMTTFEKVRDNYSKWIDTIKYNPAVIGVLGEESLYPIWNLVQCIAENDESVTEEQAQARMSEIEAAFNKYGLENYNKVISEEIDVVDNKKQVEELDIAAVGVKANKGFDKTKPIAEKYQAIHQGWNLGKVLLVNAQKNMDGTYTYNENKDLQIRFRLDQNINKLPAGETNNFSHKVIYNDNIFGDVADYGNILGNHIFKGLGKGCYFVQVTYNNQTVETVKAIDFLDKMNKNDTITLLDGSMLNAKENDGIDKVTVFVTYQTSAMNFLNNPIQDWIVETELDFK
ncbi:MAG: hypothetical protein E7262_04565 [Lachnospiraceae bacterium]|nr:hypothetical protein [Lachnospiraceae bacterium]